MKLPTYKFYKFLFLGVMVIADLVLIVQTLMKIPETDKETFLIFFVVLEIIWLISILFIFLKLMRKWENKEYHIAFMSISFAFCLLPFYATINLIIQFFSGINVGWDWRILLLILIDILFFINLRRPKIIA